ncbi:MAG TPA: prepilin peptidase [Nitrospiraceae bacterium]|nr:prepilin peptidase [Nitrospiraceae bacterium]
MIPLYWIVGLLGALIGSFLNVCIYRLPRHESIAWPGSHCPACSHPIAWYDNIPFVSYLVLRGRCRHCAVRIPWRYPVVEALNALGYVGLLWFFGATWSAVAYGLLYSALLVVAGTDLSHKVIPNVITFPGIVVGLLSAATILPLGLVNGLIGLLVGGGILWLLAWASPFLFGKEGMGGGDIKLLAMIGAFLGWKPALMTIMVGSFLGSLVGITLIAARVIKREDYIPFGPFLVCGALVALFFGQSILDWYQGLLAG